MSAFNTSGVTKFLLQYGERRSADPEAFLVVAREGHETAEVGLDELTPSH